MEGKEEDEMKEMRERRAEEMTGKENTLDNMRDHT